MANSDGKEYFKSSPYKLLKSNAKHWYLI